MGDVSAAVGSHTKVAAQRVVESYYAAFNARNFAGMLDFLSEQVAHDINQGEREVGIAAFKTFLGRMDVAYSETLRDIVICVDASGTRVAAEFIVDGTYLQADPGFPAAHGQKYTLPAATFFEVHDGKIGRVTTYYNLQDWLRQVAA